MNHIDKIIARIPSMDAEARAKLRDNIKSKLDTAPNDEGAHRVLVSLDAFEDTLEMPRRLEVTGLLAWEKRPHEKIYTFRAFYEDRVVGKIFKRADHSSTEKDVYTVEIFEQQLPGNFHHIKDARAAGEAAFAEQEAGNYSQNLGCADPKDGQ